VRQLPPPTRVTDDIGHAQAVQRRDLIRLYLVETCAHRLHQRGSRCERLVAIAYDELVAQLLPPRDDGVCLGQPNQR
jgi:hypothetical protein